MVYIRNILQNVLQYKLGTFHGTHTGKNYVHSAERIMVYIRNFLQNVLQYKLGKFDEHNPVKITNIL